jgi:hypothetical protein
VRHLTRDIDGGDLRGDGRPDAVPLVLEVCTEHLPERVQGAFRKDHFRLAGARLGLDGHLRELNQPAASVFLAAAELSGRIHAISSIPLVPCTVACGLGA